MRRRRGLAEEVVGIYLISKAFYPFAWVTWRIDYRYWYLGAGFLP